MTQPDQPGASSGGLVSLNDEKKVVEVVSESILTLWEAVNNLTRLRPTARERYRVTIFGSARVPWEACIKHARCSSFDVAAAKPEMLYPFSR